MIKSICFFLCLLTMQLQAVTLHTILVGDTLEGEISCSTEFSIDAMNRQARRIACNIGSKLDLVTFEGYYANGDNVMAYLNDLNVDPDDIVMLCFFIHGGRDRQKASKWPDLYMITERVDYGLFVERVKEKNPRLLFVMAEACNGYRGGPDIPKSDHDASTSDDQEFIKKYIYRKGPFKKEFIEDVAEFVGDTTEKEECDKYKKLFLGSSGSIVISTSSPGELSRRDYLLTGGVFSSSFLRSFREKMDLLVSIDDVSWPNILESATQKTHDELSRENIMQTPQIEINLY
jgi:hypothetical protein